MKKIRGNRRRLRQIEKWRLNNLQIDLAYLEKYNKDYVKFRIFPWNPIAMSLKNYPNPTGKIRTKIIDSFMDIYESWDRQLTKLRKTYYLKIWLFEPNIYNSQVVCALNEEIEYYENIFHTPEVVKDTSKLSLNKISTRVNKYNWTYRIDEYEISESEYLRDNFSSEKKYLEEQKWLKNELKKPKRICDKEVNGVKERIFLIKESDVWLGEKIKASC